MKKTKPLESPQEAVKLPLDFVRQLSLKVQQERPGKCQKASGHNGDHSFFFLSEVEHETFPVAGL